MPKTDIEAVVLPFVEKFVKELNGRYREHCSDQMLTALLMYKLKMRAKHFKSPAELIIEGDPNAAHEAGSWLFESILGRGCQISENEHHVTQRFAEVMAELAEPHH